MDRNQHIQTHRTAIDVAKPMPVNQEAIAEMVQTARVHRGTVSGKLARHDVRLDVDPLPVVLSVIHPGGTHTSAHCVLYDIGPGGAGLLYPGFLYSNAECMLHLTTSNHEPMMLDANIAWCRFLSRGIHCVGVRWNQAVDVRRFVPSTMWSELASVSDEHIKAEISGRVLCIGTADMEVELVRVILHDMPVSIESVVSDGAAIDKLHEKPYDLLVIDSENKEVNAEELVAKLRSEGFFEPALILAEKRRLQLTSPGDGIRYVAKPLDTESLLATVREIMLAHANPVNGSAPIESTLVSRPDMKPAIASFVKHAKAQTETIRGGIASDNFDEVRRSVLLLHNTGGGFGYSVLSGVAGEALTALDASGSAQEASPSLKLLIRVLERLKSPEAQPGAA